MAQRSDLEALFGPTLEAMGYELVGVEYQGGGRGGLLRLYIDAEQGITLDDCARVSHQVSGLLDVEDPLPGQYRLEVSSPGLDRPLFRLEHYARFIGQKVRLRLREPRGERRKFEGVIERVEDSQVVIRREEEPVELVLDVADIDKANLVPQV